MTRPTPEIPLRDRVRLAAAIAIGQQAVQTARPAADLVAALRSQLADRRAQPADVRGACDIVSSILHQSRPRHASLDMSLDEPVERIIEQLRRTPVHAPTVMRAATVELGKLVEFAAALSAPDRALDDAVIRLLRLTDRMLAFQLPADALRDVERIASVAIALELDPAITAASGALLRRMADLAALSSAP